MPDKNLAMTLLRRAFRPLRHIGGHRARLGSVAHLLTGNLLGSLLGLAGFALTARSLGPDQFGRLVLVYTFVAAVERIVSFQSWQPIIRYGAELQGPEHRDDLRMLLKFGLLLDLGAAVCAFAVAVVCGLLASSLFGWSADTTSLLVLYSGVLLFQLSGTPTAVQRMAGKFRLLAYGQLVNLALRVTLCLVGFFYSAGLGYFAAVWAGTQILGALTTQVLAFRTLRGMGIEGLLSAPVRGVTTRFPGIWGFAWSANLSLTLWSSSQHFDTLLVGALTDPASAGLYHLAKRIGSLGHKAGSQVQAVLYPDVTRLWAKGDVGEFRRVVVQVEAFLMVFGLFALGAVAMLVQPLLLWTAGPDFLAAGPLILVQMVAVVFVLSGSAARVALLAMGRQREVLVSVVVATATFHAFLVLSVPVLGPIGGNIAHVLFGLLWTAGLAVSLRRALRSHRPPSNPPFASLRRVDDDLLPSKSF
ncbi:membrane protein [Aureimonas sp. SA4125]|uniref:lipopolysaccharide biosynthesis protein n=1 Tax=Aureimonas sp. SA4125 TaxID=2826993 RepID=UPI001CC3F558|nr:lipopolysaccharide biosynthesis protein [Aureimonas sp. SA4125]BDA82954.1 membrane protein [Aureimonas sp. SA4125]